MMLCREWKVTTTSRVVAGQPTLSGLIKLPEDVQLALIPLYCHSAVPPQVGYLSRPERIGTLVRQPQNLSRPTGITLRQPPALDNFQINAVTPSFLHEATQFAPFRLSEWPARKEELHAALTTAVESFLKVVQSRTRLVGR